MQTQIIQLWLSVGGEALDYPGIPSRSSIDLVNGKLVAEFPVEAVEIASIAAKKQFRIDRDFELPVLLHCTPRLETAKLTDDSGLTGYEIKRQEAATTEALAWLETPLPTAPKNQDSPTHSTSLLAVVDEIVGNGQVIIQEKGVIRCSRDLIGKTIRVRLMAFCDRRVVRLLEPLDQFRLHAIIQEGGETKYLEVRCNPATATAFSSLGYRRLEAVFDPTEIKSSSLDG